MIHLDALVIGGGPAGATAGCLLARAGWRVLILEKKSFPRRKVCGEYISATTLPLLDRLGVAVAFRERAGPDVRRVALWAGDEALTAPLPTRTGAGRALGREHLDGLLLEQARQAGADIRQPWSAEALERRDREFICRASAPDQIPLEISTPIVIAAHGSWEPGNLPTQAARHANGPAELLGFKAHFRGAALPDDLMPLLAFPGGYGGMVHTDDGRVSVSLCVRRAQLDRLRSDERNAGAAVQKHLMATCRGARLALTGAARDGPWLGAGPIRPGIRLCNRGGLFQVGNAAAEAHPVVAEGITMAIQGAALLADTLTTWRRDRNDIDALPRVAEAYMRSWRRAFASRLYTAAAVAHWAMRPHAVAGALPLIRWFPALLSWGARLSGKATRAPRAPSAGR